MGSGCLSVQVRGRQGSQVSITLRCHQTWQAGKSTNKIGVFNRKITYTWCIFQQAMSDYRRVHFFARIGFQTVEVVSIRVQPFTKPGYLNSGLHIGRLWAMRCLEDIRVEPGRAASSPHFLVSTLQAVKHLQTITYPPVSSKVAMEIPYKWRFLARKITILHCHV